MNFHFYERAGKSADLQVKVPAGALGAVKTNLREKPEGTNLEIKDNKVAVSIEPYEILAFRVDYPAKTQ